MNLLLVLFYISRTMKIRNMCGYIFILLLVSCHQKDEGIYDPDQSYKVVVNGIIDSLFENDNTDVLPHCIVSVIRNNVEVQQHSFFIETTAARSIKDMKYPLLELNLPSGEYYLLAWIDYRITEDSPYYITENLRSVRMKSEVAGMDKKAYAAVLPLTIFPDSPIGQICNLDFYSPLSSYTLTTDLKEESLDERMTAILTYKGYLPVAYDVLSGRCVASLANPTMRYDGIQKERDKYIVASDCLFMNKGKISSLDMGVMIGNSKGGIVYHAPSISFSLEAARHITKHVEMADLGESNIIDGEITGEINIIIN